MIQGRNQMRSTSLLAAVAFAVLAAACAEKEPAPAPAETVETAPAPVAPDYAALLLAGDRLVADAGRDVERKPAEVLAFSKIMTGNTVFEMEAGGGYYTELLSRAVGPDGKVHMQAPAEFEEFYKADQDVRLADSRLPNVVTTQSHFDQLDAPDASVDVVTWFQGPHEVYFKPPNAPEGFGDAAGSHAEVMRILKPGGYYVVMDHAAAAGAPETTGGDLHRIDPAIIKASIEAAGFVLEEESALLANPADDYTKGVFDPAVRGKTDQFLLRYRKPA
jgi:predicted methyltransferase